MPKRPVSKFDIGMAKVGTKMMDEFAYNVDSFALPIVRNKQEKFVRRAFKESNTIRHQVNLPQKTYKRINSKGEMEIIT